MEKALERMEKLNRPMINRKKMNMDLDSAERSGKDVVYMKGVSKSFDTKKLFEDVNMHIQYQDRTAIVGDNGTGKSTLLKMILDEVAVDEGEVRKGSNLKVGYLSQHVYTNIQNESVIETFRNGISVTEGEARHILARFLFYGHAVFRKVSQLSGGEKMRLRLAQLMHQDINFLILDEPTNHLDIESREVLEEALEDYQGTILAVSHDRYFINKLIQKIYWIDQRKVHFFAGDYDWAKDKMNEQRKAFVLERPIKQKNVRNKPEMNKISDEKIVLEIENKIEELETNLLILEDELAQEQTLESLQKLYQKKESWEKSREQLYQQLEELL